MMNLGQIAKNAIGLDVSNRENVYGCVEGATTLLQIAGVKTKERLSTTRIFQEFLGDNRFIEVTEPQAGDIITTPTESNSKRGHIGIFLDDHRIASNNSLTFKWDDHIENYFAWQMKYKGMKTKIFRYNEGIPIEGIKEINENLSWIEKAIAQIKKEMEELFKNRKLRIG